MSSSHELETSNCCHHALMVVGSNHGQCLAAPKQVLVPKLHYSATKQGFRFPSLHSSLPSTGSSALSSPPTPCSLRAVRKQCSGHPTSRHDYRQRVLPTATQQAGVYGLAHLFPVADGQARAFASAPATERWFRLAADAAETGVVVRACRLASSPSHAKAYLKFPNAHLHDNVGGGKGGNQCAKDPGMVHHARRHGGCVSQQARSSSPCLQIRAPVIESRCRSGGCSAFQAKLNGTDSAHLHLSSVQSYCIHCTQGLNVNN